ncbi:MAG: 2-isopropylmalate synthase, partial [Firmicutes bacterium]|nr:2-isopropylmalate synthase [Bacillota bacterium]
IFDTGKILNRPPKVMISNTSGVSGIAVWINQHLKLKGDDAVTKTDPIVLFLKKWVDQQYDEGRVTAITDGELEEQMQIFMAMQGDEEHLH